MAEIRGEIKIWGWVGLTDQNPSPPPVKTSWRRPWPGISKLEIVIPRIKSWSSSYLNEATFAGGWKLLEEPGLWLILENEAPC